MDDLQMEGALLRDTLDKIASINRWLGGNRPTLSGLNKVVSKVEKKKLTIVDLGCGNGDMLRAIRRSKLNKRCELELIGIDANQDTIDYAKELSEKHSIEYRCLDVFSPEMQNIKADVVIATLFCHHFTEKEIIDLLSNCRPKLGFVINDLHRSKMAYILFKLLSLFIRNPMVRNDGAVSILRGFKRNDLRRMSRELSNNRISLRWKWAFRYQWIIWI